MLAVWLEGTYIGHRHLFLERVVFTIKHIILHLAAVSCPPP